MAITREQKEKMISEYADRLKRAKGLVLAKFEGLKVNDVETLRSQCRAENVDYVVAKKRLIKRAMEEAGITGFDQADIDTGVASIFSYEDEVAPARIVSQFAKDHEALQPYGGVLEQAFIGKDKVSELAKLPSKHELLGKVVGTIQAPVSGFVGVLSGTLRSLVGVLSAVKDSKQ